jgi:hypothetical protein
MRRFTDPIRECIRNRIWMPALTSALTLPDICAWLETPDVHAGARYQRWSKAWFEPKYTRMLPRPNPKFSPLVPRNTHNEHPLIHVENIFLSAADLYALRCAVTHSGSQDISDQRARESLRKFEFRIPGDGNVVHCNRTDDRLQLQVDIFCQEICDAVDDWDTSKRDDKDIQDRKVDLVSFAD